MLGWSFASYIDATAGAWADRFGCYALTRWNYIYREFSEAGYYGNTHWGTVLLTSVDPTPYWPGLPPRSTWRWKGSFQGVTFMASGEGLHSIQEELVGCNQNRGLRAYVTYYFYDQPHGQVFVVPAWRTCTN